MLIGGKIIQGGSGSRGGYIALKDTARIRRSATPLPCFASGTSPPPRAFHPASFQSRYVSSVLSRSQHAIHRLIASAHALSLAHTATRLVTYTPAKGNTYWHETSSRPARSLESVVLPEGVKERVVADLGDFLGGARWYAERGTFVSMISDL